mgnify:CR=1 FL=1
MKYEIEIKSIKKNDSEFLYQLLLDRDPIVNISHKKMPTYNQHLKFLKSKPYSKWYIIWSNEQRIGSVYLSKQNEIGIVIKKEYQKELINKTVLKLIINQNPRQRYLINIAPKNIRSKRLFEKNGFKLIQHTYELIT